MESQQIVLLKKRDFSQKLNATIEFIRQNFRNLFKSLLYIAGPITLVVGIAVVFIQRSFFLMTQGTGFEFNTTRTIETFQQTALVILVSFLAIMMVITVVNSYIKVYGRKESSYIEVNEVWQETKKHYLSVLLASIIVAFVTLAATFFFIIPGIYVGVALSLIFIIIIFEDKNPFDAFGRCFKLISGKWWSTFGLIIVVGILQYVIGLVFTTPLLIFQFLNMFNSLETMDVNNMNTGNQIIFITLNSISTIASYFLSAILYIALAFQYFNLVERKEATGLMSEIQNMGNVTPDEEKNF